MQRSASDNLEANITAISTSSLHSSECIVSAIGNTINNNAITVSGPNLGTHCIHIHNTHLQQTQAVSCKDIGYIYTVYYWKFCRNGDPAILNEQFQWVGEWF